MITTKKEFYNNIKILTLILVSVGLLAPVLTMTLNELDKNGSSTSMGPNNNNFISPQQKGGNNPILLSNSSPDVLCDPTCPDPW